MHMENEHVVLNTEEARQGQRVRGMTTVLIASSLAALAAMAVIAVITATQ
jgi:hypothetical protein